VPAATVCVDLSCLHISSHKNKFLKAGALAGPNLDPFSSGVNNQNGDEQSSPTAWERGDRGGIW